MRYANSLRNKVDPPVGWWCEAAARLLVRFINRARWLANRAAERGHVVRGDLPLRQTYRHVYPAEAPFCGAMAPWSAHSARFASVPGQEASSARAFMTLSEHGERR